MGGRRASNPVHPITNRALWQMSYGHHRNVCGSRPTGLEPATCRLRIDCSQVTVSALSRLDADHEARRLQLSYGRDPHTLNYFKRNCSSA